MKDEIKEILERLNKIVPYASVPKELAYMTTNITPQECKILLDYITTLQEENENLKDFNNKLQATKDRLDKYDRENQIRIDKAIEIIDLIKPELWNISNKMTYKLIDIKNILQGNDKE